MISIKRPSVAPTVLLEEGAAGKKTICAEYDSDETEFDPSFDSNIYSHETVKEELKKIQHDKCCYCESKIPHVAYPEVEHFRPKGGCKQKAGENVKSPGYYWLAYEWSNLLLACPVCNRKKGAYFPLEDPAERAWDHHHGNKLESEFPLLIDPSDENDDPGEHIEFRRDMPYGIDEKGRKTIEILGLDGGIKRAELEERRRKIYYKRKRLYQLTNFETDRS